MNGIHPHWHETDDSVDIPVHAKEVAPVKGSIPLSHVSRRPAAIVGIAVVLSIGFLFYGGIHTLKGQLTGAAEVRITADGLEPAVITVKYGDTITWINEQPIPHILESEDFCNDKDECLYTTTMFPEESTSFTVTADIPTGTYTYFSSTAEGISGQIIVESGSEQSSSASEEIESPVLEVTEEEPLAPAAPAEPVRSRESASVSSEPESEPEEEEEEEDVSFLPLEGSSEFDYEADSQESAEEFVPPDLPVNPYTVASGKTQVDTLHSGAPLLGNQSQFLGKGKGKGFPVRNPETGAASTAAVAALLSIAILYVSTKNVLGRRRG